MLTWLVNRLFSFPQDHLRMIVSHDIDTSMLNTVEFYFLYGCNGKEMSWPRKESVLLQYSTNGGITWNVLQELHYRNESAPRFFSLELPMKARYNATRFRFWQPANSGTRRYTLSFCFAIFNAYFMLRLCIFSFL